MSDEEKKAIDKLKTLIQYLSVWKENFTIVPDDVKYLIPILNLIEKQQKEIEEAKQKEKQAYKFGYNNGCNDTSKFNDKNFIRVDKIKAKIEEIDREIEFEQNERVIIYLHKQKRVLQSLLENE